MLETILIQIFMPFFINPADPDARDAYTSGLEGAQNSYITDDESTAYPMITLDVRAHDSEFNYVDPGIYAVDLSVETGKLLILKGSRTIARPVIIQIIQLDDAQKPAFATTKIALIKDNKVFIIYKNENLEVHGFLYKSEDSSAF